LCHVIISPLIDLEKPDLVDQVINRYLFLGVLWLKSQITSTKLQTNPPAIARHERAGLKFQYPMTKTFKDETLFEYS